MLFRSVFLHLHDLSILVDQICDAAQGLGIGIVDSVFLADVTAEVTQERKRHTDLLRPSFVREWTIHAHTQNLGIGAFQRLQLLLESLHLLLSTAGEGKDIEGEHHILLAAKVRQLDVLAGLIA